MTEDTEYSEAQRRVHALRGLYVHAIVYVLVNLLLVGINLLTPGRLWFYWPLLGWGIGLLAHFVAVKGGGILGPEWEERKIRALLDKRAR